MKPLTTLYAEAVAAQIVVPAGRADQAAGWVGLQPAIVLTAVPDAVLWTQHPAMALAVEHGQITHGEPKSSGLQSAGFSIGDERLVANLCLGERVDRHPDSIAGSVKRPGVESEATEPR